MRKKRFLALALALAMGIGTAGISASATEPVPWNTQGGQQEIEGTATVTQPIIEVALPGVLNFNMDPFNKKSVAQVYGGDYNVINLSEVDVLVDVNLKAAQGFDGGKVNFASGTMVPAAVTSGTSRAGYFDKIGSGSSDQTVQIAYVVADKPAGGKLNQAGEQQLYLFDYNGTSGSIGGRTAAKYNSGTYTVENEVETIKATAQSATNKAGNIDTAKDISFLLKKVKTEEDGTRKLDLRGVSSFTLIGRCNSEATYLDGEVKVQAKYKMTLLNGTDTYGYEPADEGTDGAGSGAGWRQVKKGSFNSGASGTGFYTDSFLSGTD